FALPARTAMPVGIAAGADGALWFTQKSVNRIGRITTSGAITEFHVPSPDGQITEFGDGISWGARPLSLVVRDGALWFSEAGGNRVGRIAMDGTVTEF